jgi:hypothetical protein
MFSTDVLVCSVCGHLFSDWRIETYLRNDWRLRRGILFPNMGDRIIYGSGHHHLHRRFALSIDDMYFTFFKLVTYEWLCAS